MTGLGRRERADTLKPAFEIREERRVTTSVSFRADSPSTSQWLVTLDEPIGAITEFLFSNVEYGVVS